MILIADGGSTKTDWCLIAHGVKTRFQTEGYNPFFVDQHYITESIKRNFPAGLPYEAVEQVYYYGAGCTPPAAHKVDAALKGLFRNAGTNVASDLLAAAKALLGAETGFAAILGTGTNTCIYDGNAIAQQVPSLGYMLGDPGSGSAIGKKLLAAFLRDLLPLELKKSFQVIFNTDSQRILHHIYHEPNPNRYCAGFAPFVANHIRHSYMHQLVRSAFEDLFQDLVCHYPNYEKYTFNSVGSIGFYFKDILSEVAAAHGMETGRIIEYPIDELANRLILEKVR